MVLFLMLSHENANILRPSLAVQESFHSFVFNSKLIQFSQKTPVKRN